MVAFLLLLLLGLASCTLVPDHCHYVDLNEMERDYFEQADERVLISRDVNDQMILSVYPAFVKCQKHGLVQLSIKQGFFPNVQSYGDYPVLVHEFDSYVIRDPVFHMLHRNAYLSEMDADQRFRLTKLYIKSGLVEQEERYYRYLDDLSDGNALIDTETHRAMFVFPE